MKALLSIVFLCSISISVLAQSKTVNFTIKNAPSDSCVIAYHLDGKQYVMSIENQEEVENKVMYLDANGKASFTHSEFEKGVYVLVFLPKNETIDFLFEGKSMSLSFDFKNIATTMKTDSKANELLYQRIRLMENMQKKQADIDAKKKADPSYDAEKALDELDMELVGFMTKMYKDYPKNLAAQMFKTMEEPTVPTGLENTYAGYYYYRDHYFDNFDFSSTWISRTPFFQNKLDGYFNNLIFDHPDSIVAAWDHIIGLTAGNADMYKLLVIKGLNTYAKSKTIWHEAVYIDFVDKYYLTGKATWVDDEQLKKIEERAKAIRPNLIGKTAVNFELLASEGKTFDLNSIGQSYTILLFVATNCGPCAAPEKDLINYMDSIPADVKVQEVIYSTDVQDALSKKQEPRVFWDVAVMSKEDELSRAMNDFDLYSVPKVYVLDKDKKIIGKKVSLAQALEIIEYDKKN